jgi:dGTPase
MLAPYAVRAEHSAGRRHLEAPHPYRNAFQRDRDRIVHARAFRRLEAKTQVFTRRHSDHFRNRLTHTIEVAQISRTIAAQLGLNADLVEALALAHDVGHPPFGHAGEKALDAAMRPHGLSFDHNLHALRIVEDFELRYIGFRGLNLTFETREGIIKHSHDYRAGQHPELAEYLLDQRPPLEAQLIDLTDEIAYSTADLDDGYEARILTIDQICRGLDAFAHFYRQVDAQHAAAPEKLKFNEALKSFFNRLVTDLIDYTGRRVADAGVARLEDIRRHPERLAAFSDAVQAERAQAKQFLYDNLYFSAELLPEKHRAERVISELFAHWMAHPERLPAAYREQAEREPLARVICDFIAGMTDNFILEQHRRMFGGLAGEP